MIDHDDEKVGTLPAACQVEPAVSSFFSNRTQSVHPALHKWYNDDAPTAPPPMITTRAVVGKSAMSHSLIAVRSITALGEAFNSRLTALLIEKFDQRVGCRRKLSTHF